MFALRKNKGRSLLCLNLLLILCTCDMPGMLGAMIDKNKIGKYGDTEIHFLRRTTTTVINAATDLRLFFEHLRDCFSLRIVKEYKDTAVLVDLPEQPDRMVQLLLSLIISEGNFTEELNSAIITCFASNTSTDTSNWGLFNATRFTTSSLQAEYFVSVSEEASLSFPRRLDIYIRSGSLRGCIFAEEVSVDDTIAIEGGRSAFAHKSASIVSSSGLTPGWLAGVLVGALVLVALIGLIVASATGGKVYNVTEYEKSELEAERHAGDEEMVVDPEVMQEDLLRDLGTVAGQGGRALKIER